ncbi:MAG: hypothetical protein ED859_04400 [Desulfuromonadales bacterium]|nr:MAG: hypothetical protein ED859_04400 [Desulfuromonadales bacterium]
MGEGRLAILVRRFAVAAEAHAGALEAMDAEGANRHAAVLHRLYQEMAGEGIQGREELLLLAESRDGAVAGMAAVYSLSYDSSRAAEVLERIAAETGLLGFRASVALERWRKGEWTLE